MRHGDDPHRYFPLHLLLDAIRRGVAWRGPAERGWARQQHDKGRRKEVSPRPGRQADLRYSWSGCGAEGEGGECNHMGRPPPQTRRPGVLAGEGWGLESERGLLPPA